MKQKRGIDAWFIGICLIDLSQPSQIAMHGLGKTEKHSLHFKMNTVLQHYTYTNSNFFFQINKHNTEARDPKENEFNCQLSQIYQMFRGEMGIISKALRIKS